MFIVNGVSVVYQNRKQVLTDVSFSLEAGTINGIIGPNGAGKSTLLNAILNIIPHEGGASFNGVPLPKMARKIGYVQQTNQIDLNFPITVSETVGLGIFPRLRLFQRLNKRKYQDEINKVLDRIEMREFADRQIGQLSGGQLQRVMIGRCIIQNPELVLLDEPFAGIDAHSESTIMKILRELKAEGKTILMVHHDLNKVNDYFDNTIIIKKKLIASGSTESTFNSENMSAAYGLPMLSQQGGF
ncbi:metal ABC transporter ATP-binding protein [Lentilactobacillus sp. Marseille-Q4993]|uniref:metal ABC transporter ATP-binding protein n=1 Tax=Lentilactobacillus sp. Marseille-Q4993 TaxID=3039492 RepID=UPI0024BD4262|nr:metal ABC transporter ATP-binding protein [Lentilactobacillus sp. Marseille-Q4993]